MNITGVIFILMIFIALYIIDNKVKKIWYFLKHGDKEINKDFGEYLWKK